MRLKYEPSSEPPRSDSAGPPRSEPPERSPRSALKHLYKGNLKTLYNPGELGSGLDLHAELHGHDGQEEPVVIHSDV